MGGSDGGAGEARKQQELNQQRIEAGMQQLNSIFGGGSIGTGRIDKTAGKYDPHGTYYTANGALYGGDPTAGQDMMNKGLLYTGTQKQSGFTPEFYKQRSQDYVNTAMPQLSGQYQQMGKNLRYALAGRGLGTSSAAVNGASTLGREMNTQRQGVADEGLRQSQELERNVNSTKSQLINQLQVSADPGSAAQQALTAATGFSAPSPIVPLGSMFSNWMNIYGADLLGRQAMQQPTTQQRGPVGIGAQLPSVFGLVN